MNKTATQNVWPIWKSWDLTLGLGLVVVAFLFGCFRMWDVDIWWHLRTGQLMWGRRQETFWPWQWVPQTDWYTFTNADRPWIDLHWGFQLAAAGVYALGGVPALILLKAALGALAVGVALLARQRHWSMPVMVACWLPALVVLSGRIYERPEMVTLVFLATFLTVLFRAPEHPRLLWLLPVIQVLWVNSQPLFILGPVVMGFYWLDRLCRAAWRRAGRMASPEKPAEVPWRRLLLVTATVFAACLINPYTWRGAVFPLELFAKVSGTPAQMEAEVTELQPVHQYIGQAWQYIRQMWQRAKQTGQTVSLPGGWIYLVAHLVTLALGVVSFGVLARQGRRASGRWRIDLFRLLLFSSFAYLGWQATRNNNHFAFVAGVVTAANFAEAYRIRREGRANDVPAAKLGAKTQRAPTPGDQWSGLLLPWVSRLALSGALCVMGWALVSGHFYALAGEGRQFGLGERADWYPHGAMRFAGRDGMPTCAFVANWGHAGLYIFHNGPQRRVFTDGRLEVNSAETLRRYRQIIDSLVAGTDEWEQWLRQSAQEAEAREMAPPGCAMPALVIEVAESRRHLSEYLRRLGESDAAAPSALDPAGPILKTLIRNPRWRCVYCDPIGAVFIETSRAEQLGLPQADLRPLLEPPR